jgi:hypothetical protein
VILEAEALYYWCWYFSRLACYITTYKRVWEIRNSGKMWESKAESWNETLQTVKQAEVGRIYREPEYMYQSQSRLLCLYQSRPTAEKYI